MESATITTREAAALLKLTPRRVSGLCSEGKLQGATRCGKSWSIPESSVQCYIGKSPALCDGPRLPCAVGSTSYEEVVQNCYYVDKTLLIKDLIDDHSAVTLFTRPRRFGKTLALSMLKAYFEKSDADKSFLFHGKKIWDCGEKYQAYQGRFPVIALTFKDIKFNHWPESLEAIRLILQDEFMRHDELDDSPFLNDVDRNYLSAVKSGTLTEVQCTRALFNLSRMLEKHHHCRAIILIDEYDTPILQGHSHGYYEDVVSFLRNLLSGGLKDNPHLAFGVLTGILRIAKENLFSGLNNLVVNSILDEKYSTYFGFIPSEVEEMAGYYGRSDQLAEIRRWYDGYRFGDAEIYNPWSVTNYFHNGCRPQAFWANTGENQVIREILQSVSSETAEELISLLQGSVVSVSVNMEVIYPRLTDGPDQIFSFLLVAGYLKAVHPATETETGTFLELQLPNMEVQRVYNTEILAWLQRSLEPGIVPELEKALFLNDGERLKKALQRYMESSISYFDGAAEGFYHGMMLGLTAGLSSKYHILSNRESGDGRFDLALEPKDPGLPGILMEFKAGRLAEKDALHDLALNGLQQMIEKHYDYTFLQHGITNIARYGIAFCGKQVEIAQG